MYIMNFPVFYNFLRFLQSGCIGYRYWNNKLIKKTGIIA